MRSLGFHVVAVVESDSPGEDLRGVSLGDFYLPRKVF